ncbi:GIY-YIG nuclease family protein [Mesorhizobium sp. SP-1A]|uniref:GIY-YIG nuclease family protein n=1 Tax=Mesorhizobium sp. SP-1A TaxID=3077840 RepID=UPI0028F6C46F|nr:GIY-YIG nuclease family protein [Mesorhizobium sp. SP-1A]
MKSPKKEGYVYILSNPTMPGIVKIGKTVRTPEARLKELNSATGVAMPFKLETVVETKNPSLTERIIHEHLSSRRINQRREFFEVSVKDATRVATQAAKRTHSRVYSGRQRKVKKSVHIAQSIASFAIFTWTAMFSPALSIVGAIMCTWAMATGTPRTLWEFLTLPSIFGRYSATAFLLLALYPPVTGQIDASKFTRQSLQNEYQRMIFIGSRI